MRGSANDLVSRAHGVRAIAYPISKPKSSRCALCSRRQLLLKFGHLLVGPLGESTMWKPLLPTLGKPLLIFEIGAQQRLAYWSPFFFSPIWRESLVNSSAMPSGGSPKC